MRKRVFLSYSMEDKPAVYSALKTLEGSHLKAVEIDDPADWAARTEDARTAIRDRIRRADSVLVIWSQSAGKSAWVQYELGMALALEVPIHVLLAGASPADLPASLTGAPILN